MGNEHNDDERFIHLVKNGVPLADPFANDAADSGGLLRHVLTLDPLRPSSYVVDTVGASWRERARRQMQLFATASARDAGTTNECVGWKESSAMFFLPFVREVFASMLLVLVVRDGRDVALSRQQR